MTFTWRELDSNPASSIINVDLRQVRTSDKDKAGAMTYSVLHYELNLCSVNYIPAAREFEYVKPEPNKRLVHSVITTGVRSYPASPADASR